MRLAVVLISLMAMRATAQPATLIGTVHDAENGSPLIGATVSYGQQGVAANSSGAFRLNIPELPATVTVRFLGYAPLAVTLDRSDVEAGNVITRTFRLQPVEIELGDIMVTDENAALGIMRQVLARKAELVDRIGSYRAEAYTRFTLRSRGRYVRFTEELSDAFWYAGGGSREVVLARRRRPDGNAFRYAAPQTVPDFYLDDDVDLDGFRFPSPTHPDALSIYHFRIGGISEVDGMRLIDIAVRPQRSGATALSGRIQVIDSLFVFAEAELRPAGGVYKPSPVQDYRASYRTVFTPAGDDFWLPERLYMQGRVNVGAPGARLPEVRFQQSTFLAVRQTGFPGPDSLWASSDTRIDDASVYGGREVFLAYRADFPLSDEEAIAEQSLGPIPLRGLLPPEGLLRNYVPIPVEEPSDEEDAPEDRSLSDQLVRAPRLWYNRVDRTHIGLAPTFYTGDWLSVQPGAGLSLDTSLYVLGLSLEVAATERVSLAAHARHGTRPRYDSPAYTRMFNTIPTYLGWPDYFDYLTEDRIEGSVNYDIGSGWQTSLTGSYAKQEFVIATSMFEGAVTGDGQRENPPVDDGALRSVGLSFTYGERPSRFGVVETPYVEMDVEHGGLDPSVEAETLSHTRFSFRAEAAVPTFFRRRPDPHMLRVRAVGGITFGDAIPQRLGVVDGSIGPLAGFGTLRTVNLPYDGDRWLGVVWSYEVGRTLFHSLGFDFPTGLALHGGHAWTDLAADENLGFSPRTIPGGHHEIGGSLMQPFGYPFRVDLTRRLGVGGGWVWTFGLVL
ncbi:MAG: DUF5686 family protein [Rubricoccaceae bacterium]|nr:DUF5686 family protein [Rubricoccaceae bacterium]